MVSNNTLKVNNAEYFNLSNINTNQIFTLNEERNLLLISNIIHDALIRTHLMGLTFNIDLYYIIKQNFNTAEEQLQSLVIYVHSDTLAMGIINKFIELNSNVFTISEFIKLNNTNFYDITTEFKYKLTQLIETISLMFKSAVDAILQNDAAIAKKSNDYVIKITSIIDKAMPISNSKNKSLLDHPQQYNSSFTLLFNQTRVYATTLLNLFLDITRSIQDINNLIIKNCSRL